MNGGGAEAVTGLFRLFGFFRTGNSARKARERLVVMVFSDRLDITPRALESLKKDMVETVSKHLPIERGGVNVKVENYRDGMRLVAVFPVAWHRALPAGSEKAWSAR